MNNERAWGGCVVMLFILVACGPAAGSMEALVAAPWAAG